MKKMTPLITDEDVDELIRNFRSESARSWRNTQENIHENDTDSSSREEQPLSTNHDTLPVRENRPLSAADEINSVGQTSFDSSTSDHGNRFSILKTVSLCLAVAALTWLLPSGNVMDLEKASASSKDRDTFYQVSSVNLMSASLSEIHKIKRRYILEMSDVPTPAPDYTKFEKIYDDERQNFDGKPIEHYKDETIEVKCWRETIQGCTFNFSEVWIADPSQLRRTLVDNVISKKHLDYPQNIFNKTNGVVGMSADYCAFRYYGIIMQYGSVVRKSTSGFLDIAVYDKYGNFSYYTDNDEFFESDVFRNGEVIHTFAFGPMLVDDYKVNSTRKITLSNKDHPGELDQVYPRAAICQFAYDKHYLLCTVDMKGLTAKDFAIALQSKGVRFAYNLDGGQTATLLFNREIINKVAYNKGPRLMSDILYFATAVPEN